MIKKKGRKPKSYYENLKNNDISNNLIINENKQLQENTTTCNLKNKNISSLPTEIKIPKKRGRKPKGGKIVEIKNIYMNTAPKPNVILHLKCLMTDIEENDIIKYTPDFNVIDNYNLQDTNLNYNYILYNDISNNKENIKINNNDNNIQLNDNNIQLNDNNIQLNDKNIQLNDNNIQLNDNNIKKNNNFKANYIIKDNNKHNDYIKSNDDNTRKKIDKKIKDLAYNLKFENINQKSACFWCTCDFDNEPIYIPKNYINEKYNCYGCFCSPECACAHLMSENIDTSCKFERYYLLNNIYGKIYNYEKNIKPAPSPYYLLNKFYGTLDIQEYRKLLKYERLLLVIDKPLTKNLPEIYEENDDFLINNKFLSKQR